MSYEDQLRCNQTKCGGQLTVPIKLVVKGSNVIDVARCPTCQRSYKIVLPLKDKDQWMPLVSPAFFSCDVCGTSNANNWEYKGKPWGWGSGYHYRHHQNRIRIVIRCKNCKKARAKIASAPIWADLTKSQEKPTEAPPEPTYQCPHCHAEITKEDKVCPSCKTEIVCDKCGAPISPGASFCSTCGDPVEKFDLSPDSEIPKEKLCPTCNEEYEDGSMFCPVCGQELICDKCGTSVREGAIFCVDCGDEIKKGELSE